MTTSRLYPARPILAASVCVFRDGLVLVAGRTKPPGDTLFSLPGGLVEPGETIEAAALRECLEETGVSAEIVAFNAHVEVITRDEAGGVREHYVVCSFVGRWLSGEGESGPEARDTQWIAPGAVSSLRTTEGLLPILASACAIMAGGR